MSQFTLFDQKLVDEFQQAFNTGVPKVSFTIQKSLSEEGEEQKAIGNIQPLFDVMDEINAAAIYTDFADTKEMMKALMATTGEFHFILDRENFDNMIDWNYLPKPTVDRLKF